MMPRLECGHQIAQHVYAADMRSTANGNNSSVDQVGQVLQIPEPSYALQVTHL